MVPARSLRFTAVLALVAAAVVPAAAASAAVSPATAYAEQARLAAEAADQAFIDADWDEARSQAAAFDVAYNHVRDLWNAAATAKATSQAKLTAAQSAAATAKAAFDAANAQLALYEAAVDDATAAADAAQSAFVSAYAEYLAALARLQNTPKPTVDCVTDSNGITFCTEIPSPAWEAAKADVDAKSRAHDSAQAASTAAREAQRSAEIARASAYGDLGLRALESDKSNADAAVQQATAELADATSSLDGLSNVLDGLADYSQSVADRRADLADLDSIRQSVVWTLGANNTTPHAGDRVTVNFAVPNSDLYALSDVAVRVVSPTGITPSCDLVGGTVAAGAVVHCSAVYVPTDADAAKGAVTFEVELTGYLPLGPGNPRGRAVTRTLLTVEQSLTMPVAAKTSTQGGTDTDTGTDTGTDTDTGTGTGTDELSQTGLDSAHLGTAAFGMMLAGCALLAVRRRTASPQR